LFCIEQIAAEGGLRGVLLERADALWTELDEDSQGRTTAPVSRPDRGRGQQRWTVRAEARRPRHIARAPGVPTVDRRTHPGAPADRRWPARAGAPAALQSGRDELRRRAAERLAARPPTSGAPSGIPIRGDIASGPRHRRRCAERGATRTRSRAAHRRTRGRAGEFQEARSDPDSAQAAWNEFRAVASFVPSGPDHPLGTPSPTGCGSRSIGAS
jgi:hypothetical protein